MHMRRILITILLAVSMTSAAFAGELFATRSKDMTSKDISLKFVLEKTTWDEEDVLIWGTVENTGTAKYRAVQVVFTVRDARGKFIGRHTWYVEPDEIGPEQVGYIEQKHVYCEGRKPSQIEFSVIGMMM